MGRAERGPPAHWRLRPLRWLGRIQTGLPKGKAVEGEPTQRFPYLRVANVQNGYLDLDDIAEIVATPIQAAAHLLRRGDVLMNEGGDYDKLARGAVWEGQIEPCLHQNHVFAFRPSVRVNSHWVSYETQAPRLRHYFAVASKQTTNLASISVTALGAAPIWVPPRDEQDAIVAFLDDATARIDALLAESGRVVMSLRQRREAVITLAVLGRLAPTPSLRPSGVGWVGDIPSHWEVKKIRHVARMESGHTPSRSNKEYWQNCTIPWVSLADVRQFRGGQVDEIFETEERISELGLANSSARLLPKGTVILSRTASVGFSVMLGCAMATTQDFVNWVCGPRLLPRYLLACFRAMGDEFRHLRQGSVHNTIYMPDAAGLVIPLPPIEEQRTIAAHIAAETARIDAAIAAAERVAALLRQRRVSLIHAAVSGAIDTRIAGAGAWPSSDAA